MDLIGGGLVALNLLLGIAGAAALARRPGAFPRGGSWRRFFLLVLIYGFESAAVAAGMASQVFAVGTAFLWGPILGLRLRGLPPRSALHQATLFTAYTCLPSLSLLAIPVLTALGGWDILSLTAATRFGIPEWLHLPWPLGTILGFFSAVVCGSMALKAALTLGLTSLVYLHYFTTSTGE
ncbi:hypothetical protein LLH00_15415 [bacterium]|nr:hypothetical protein [bacterium]